jgi:biopolymer transport protein ExbB
MKLLRFILLHVALCLPAFAQETPSPYQQGAQAAQRDLEASLKELAKLRESIAAEKLPLTRELRRLEDELLEVRRLHEQTARLLDTRNLDLGNLRTEIKARQEEKTYLSNLLDEYIRNLETRVHITELQRYRTPFEAARLAAENKDVSAASVFAQQAGVVDLSIQRIQELVGGATFKGAAVGADGLVKQGTVALVGPVALFASDDGSSIGLAEQKIGSLEPMVVKLPEPMFADQVGKIAKTGFGQLPFDPSLGSAQKIAETKETFIEHFRKGGPVMWPILILAIGSFLIGLIKLVQLLRVRRLSYTTVEPLLDAVQARDYEKARSIVATLTGPSGEMLGAGVEHLGEPNDLVEEVMYEKVMETRLKLQSLLPFITVVAASAPLLGLLGTVTGIINTFKLNTVFGTVDPKMLSSGISEALITTEYGLVVAIPSLLLSAWLSRQAKGITDGMEKNAIAFMNRLAKTPATPSAPVEIITT